MLLSLWSVSEANATAACLFFDTVKWCTYKLNLRENKMKINLPKKSTFYISVVFAVLGLLGAFGVPFLAGFSFWLLLLGYAVLVAGLFLKGF